MMFEQLFAYLCKERTSRQFATRPRIPAPIELEGLENRTLFSTVSGVTSAYAVSVAPGAGVHRSLASSSAATTKVAFSTVPAAVQSGLTALAQGTTIDPGQLIRVRTASDGTSTYSTVLAIDGKANRVSVDASGAALEGKIQFADAPAAVQSGLQAQDTAGTIADTQLVQIHTGRGGTTTYKVYSTTITVSGKATTIAVDETGTTIARGHQGDGAQDTVDFSTTPSAVQTGLSALSQGTTIAADQQIHVFTARDGTSIYSTFLNINGTGDRIAVDASGNPLEGRIAFSAAPAAVKTGLQALDTAGTIPGSQLVEIHSFFNGNAIYSTTVTLNNEAMTIAVDSSGASITQGGKIFGSQSTVAYSAAPAAVKTGLSALSEGTTIDPAQVLNVFARSDGTSVYSTILSVNGRPTRIAVDSTGKALEGSIAFSAAPSAVQTGLQAQDTAGTIPADQLVQIRTQEDNATVYSTSVTLSGRATTISVDASGATLSGDNGGGEHGGGGFGRHGFGSVFDNGGFGLGIFGGGRGGFRF